MDMRSRPFPVSAAATWSRDPAGQCLHKVLPFLQELRLQFAIGLTSWTLGSGVDWWNIFLEGRKCGRSLMRAKSDSLENVYVGNGDSVPLFPSLFIASTGNRHVGFYWRLIEPKKHCSAMLVRKFLPWADGPSSRVACRWLYLRWPFLVGRCHLVLTHCSRPLQYRSAVQ